MSAKVISMNNQKGGCGKTTTAKNSAVSMASLGKRVLIIDTDPQSTTYKFFLRNLEAFPNGYDGVIDVATADLTVLESLLEEHKESYDYIFIDTKPVLGSAMNQIIQLSDLVIVCAQPTFDDVESTESIVDVIKANQAQNPKLKSAICITRRRNNTNISKRLAALKAYDLPIMATQIRDYYRAYDTSAELGVSIIHLDSSVDGAVNASADIHEFTTEILSILGE